jgi:universal stress protein A
MKEIERILVPLDFSAHTPEVLRYAVDVAQRYGAALVLLHVLQAERYVLPGQHMLPGPEGLELISAEIDLKLAGMARGLRDANLRIECEVRRGPAIPNILLAARDARADMIIMGTHGHTGLKHLWIGSVAESIVRTAPCPVLTVRARADADQPGLTYQS